MADVFISYSRDDRTHAERLATALTAEGLVVWWDPHIEPGEDFDEVIEGELEAARCVVVLWSERSRKSRYVKGEARYAMKRGKLVPALIQEEVKAPLDFHSIHAARIHEWEGDTENAEYQKLVRRVAWQVEGAGPGEDAPSKLTAAEMSEPSRARKKKAVPRKQRSSRSTEPKKPRQPAEPAPHSRTTGTVVRDPLRDGGAGSEMAMIPARSFGKGNREERPQGKTQLIKIAGWPETRGHVVFVHGLGGHAYDTWTHGKDPANLWPRWLAREIEGLSAWTLSYAAPPTNWLGTAMPLQDRAVGVLERLLAEPELAQGSLVFVCHSLGGLVVKQLLREANDQQQRRPEVAALLARVKGVVFIATPHTGSAHASLLDRLRLLVWPSTATQDLVKNDPNLRNLNVWYRNWSTGLAHRVFFETQDTSADAGLPGVVPIPIDANHIDICKPAGESDLIYASTRDFLVNDIFPASKGAKSGAEPKTSELPPAAMAKLRNWVPVALRLAVLVALGFVFYKGMEAVFWPTYPPVDVEAFIEKQQAQHHEEIARLEGRYQDDLTDWKQQAHKAVTALANLRGQPDAPPGIEEALAKLDDGQTKEAEAIFKKALALNENLGRKQGMAADYANLGNVYEIRGDLEQAEAMHRKALAINEALGRKEGMANDYTNLGNVYRTRGDLEQAEAMYQTALAIDEALGRKEGMANDYTNLGNVYYTRGDLEQAEAMYKKALGLFQSIGAAPQVEQVQGLLVEVRQSD